MPRCFKAPLEEIQQNVEFRSDATIHWFNTDLHTDSVLPVLNPNFEYRMRIFFDLWQDILAISMVEASALFYGAEIMWYDPTILYWPRNRYGTPLGRETLLDVLGIEGFKIPIYNLLTHWEGFIEDSSE